MWYNQKSWASGEERRMVWKFAMKSWWNVDISSGLEIDYLFRKYLLSIYLSDIGPDIWGINIIKIPYLPINNSLFIR